MCVLSTSPSLSQSISTVNVSSVPTSAIVPESVVTPFSGMGVAERSVSVGATLLTWTSFGRRPSKSSSVTVTQIGMSSTVVPVGSSSRYWCV